MSFEMYLFLLGIILILIDVFFPSDIPTFIAIILFCVIFYRSLRFPVLVNIILTIVFFFIVLVGFIALWKKIRDILVNKWFARDVYKAGIYGLAGKAGTVYLVEGRAYAKVDGDLYAFFKNYDLQENSDFVVKEVRDGKIVIDIMN